MMFHQEQEPVKNEELTQCIPIEKFDSWVTSLFQKYHNDQWYLFLLKNGGNTKYLKDELAPLSAFCRKVAPSRPNRMVQYLGWKNQSFDAQILLEGKVEETLEITLACHGHREAIASEALALHGYSPQFVDYINQEDLEKYLNMCEGNEDSLKESDLSKIFEKFPCLKNLEKFCPHEFLDKLRKLPRYRGQKKNNDRDIPRPELITLNSNHIIKEALANIEEKVRKKDQHYLEKYKNVNLIVAFDDSCLLSYEHFDHARQALTKIKTKFNTIYYVGLRGSFFLESPL